mmetsp:Transcript_65461/g.150068  ORF Transcript_65461/g.150068 Transcript_65461/m.150068 type:complete len:371 (+) Transcript_65461:19-1131(+)
MASQGQAKVVVNLSDFESAAREVLDPVDYDYYASGAEEEQTLRRNYEAWREITIWPRILVDVSQVSLKTRFLGVELDMPVMVPPMAMQKLAHSDGEVGLAAAAAEAGVMYCITQQATTKLETICEQAPGPKLFQMYMFKDRKNTEALLRRAESSKVLAIVVTVDSPVLGRREKDIRNKFTPASRGVEIVNWKDEAKPKDGNVQQAVAARTGSRDSGFSWEGLAWLRTATKLPVILKGVEHPADARRAVEAGCSAIWVSNHGGRQLDGGPATAEALPGVVAAVQGRVPVIVDGGVTRGADVLRGLALGASIVCVGRPLLWALAADGKAGAKMALGMVREELSTALALSGVAGVDGISRDLVQAPGDPRPRL